jgi:Cu(I)/Ag(I) efflux system protein CusF
MKLISKLPLIVAISFSTAAFAQSTSTTSSESGAMHGMKMKSGMDMGDCKHMKGMKGMEGMDMKDMDAKKCKDMMKGMKTDKSASSSDMHSADGVVKGMDPSGKVTLQHGPVKSLGWPAMSMGFAVKDKALMDKLAVGNKVHVEFQKQGSDYVITSVK